MKIALCFSAHLREYKRYLPNINACFIKPLSEYGAVDCFVHTWNTLGPKYSWHTYGNGTGGLDIIPVSADEIKEAFNPKISIIEDYEKTKPTLLLKNFTEKIPTIPALYQEGILSCVCTFYKIYQCNEIKKQFELENNFKYDMVIRLRPDMNYTNIDFKTLDYKNNIYVPYIYGEICYDHLAIGSSENIDKYANCFNYLTEIYKENFDFGGEKTLCKYLKRFVNIPVVSICNGFKVWK